MHSTTRISIYSVVFEIEAKQVLVILFSSSTFPENSREQVKLPLLRANFMLVAQMENDTKFKVRNSLSNATLSNAVLESTLIPFSFKNI